MSRISKRTTLLMFTEKPLDVYNKFPEVLRWQRCIDIGKFAFRVRNRTVGIFTSSLRGIIVVEAINRRFVIACSAECASELRPTVLYPTLPWDRAALPLGSLSSGPVAPAPAPSETPRVPPTQLNAEGE